MTDNKDSNIVDAGEASAKVISSNDYRKFEGVVSDNGDAIPPEMASVISMLVANRSNSSKGNSTMRIVSAKEMEEKELKREKEEALISKTYEVVESSPEATEEAKKSLEQFMGIKDSIDYGYPIRMTLKFLDNTDSGVPHIMTIRRLDYLDPETDNEEFPEYSRWFMSNLPAYDKEDPSSYDPDADKVYTFDSSTVEVELGAFEVIKYLPYIGSTWDYSSEADPGEKTGKMVPASEHVVFYKRPVKESTLNTENASGTTGATGTKDYDAPTIITMPSAPSASKVTSSTSTLPSSSSSQ